MGSVLKHKDSGERKKSRILGIVFIAVTTIICYLVGWIISQSVGFQIKTNIYLNINKHGVSYFLQLISMAVPLIVYNLSFSSVANTKPTDANFMHTNDKSKPYIYKGWALKAILLSGVFSVVAAFLIYTVVFKSNFALVAPLMIWVWIAQAIFSTAVFFIPLFKPLKY